MTNRVALILILLASCCVAQNVEPKADEKGVSFGEGQTARWQVGVVIKATRGPMRSAFATVPVPVEWPEQEVKVVEEKISRGVKVSHRDLGGVRQMLVRMPGIANGKSAGAVFTYEITRKKINAPEDPSVFEIPKRVPRNLKRWLNSSPYIESRDSKIRKLARAAVEDEVGAWDKVEAIYDLVREKVEYREGKIKTATQALRDGYGDCEEMTSVFIAMCRSIKVPARMVWVPDHCYPEFYLVDDDGKGHWIPCQAAGTRAFGSMPEPRPILQKGDNFKVAEKPKPQRYVSEFVKATPVRGSKEPQVTFIREFLNPEPGT